MTERKSFGVAILIWLFFGGLGGHRIYVQEKFHFLLWYWLGSFLSLGALPLIDAFFIKRLVKEANENVIK